MKRTEGLSYSSDNRYRSVYVMSAMLFIALITVIMAFFFVANRHRVINQNKNYLSDAVKQKIVNFHEKVDDNLDIIKTVSYLYGRAVVKDGKVNLRLLKELEDNTGFDYVRFIDADGIDHTAEGERADCSDRPDFIDGMKNGFETTARKNTFDKLLFEQVKKWLIAKGKANTKSFNGLSKLNAEQLLNEFCKADGEEKNAERMQAFKKRVEDILATESSNIE